MSAQPIISIEGLAKCYRIRRGQRQGYVALRDVVSDGVSRLFRRAATPACEGAIVDFWALQDVSFEIAAGEVVGIIGRNGAGKSTLLKILSRITEPTRGRIRLGGRLASLLEVGTGFHPELTGRENIFLNGAILGMTRAEIRRNFDEIVTFAEVEKFLDTPVKRYSSGMYVRLAFAVAAHLETEILLVDEVLAVGDAQFQKKCLGKMGEVARGGRTVLFVSHNLGTMTNLCTTGVVLKEGRLVFRGPVLEAIRSYNASIHSGHGVHYEAAGPAIQPRIRRIVLEQTDVEDADYRTESPLSIIIEIDVLDARDAACTVLIRNSNGVCVYHGSDEFGTDFDNYSRREHRRCVVPAFALNAETYFLTVALGSRSANQLFEKLDDILRFSIRFDGNVGGRLVGTAWRGTSGPGLFQWQ